MLISISSALGCKGAGFAADSYYTYIVRICKGADGSLHGVPEEKHQNDSEKTRIMRGVVWEEIELAAANATRYLKCRIM